MVSESSGRGMGWALMRCLGCESADLLNRIGMVKVIVHIGNDKSG